MLRTSGKERMKMITVFLPLTLSQLQKTKYNEINVHLLVHSEIWCIKMGPDYLQRSAYHLL
jgi:hypothetical protein